MLFFIFFFHVFFYRMSSIYFIFYSFQSLPSTEGDIKSSNISSNAIEIFWLSEAYSASCAHQCLCSRRDVHMRAGFQDFSIQHLRLCFFILAQRASGPLICADWMNTVLRENHTEMTCMDETSKYMHYKSSLGREF